MTVLYVMNYIEFYIVRYSSQRSKILSIFDYYILSNIGLILSHLKLIFLFFIINKFHMFYIIVIFSLFKKKYLSHQVFTIEILIVISFTLTKKYY